MNNMQQQKVNKVMTMLKNTVCAVCLSGARQFVDDPFIANKVLFLFPKFFTLNMGDKMCWECYKRLKNVVNFHQRAKQAQLAVDKVAKAVAGCNETTLQLYSLSSLKTKMNVVRIDIPPDNLTLNTSIIKIEKETDVYQQDQFEVPITNRIGPFSIKTEIPDENETNVEYNSQITKPIGVMNQNDSNMHQTAVNKSPDIDTEVKPVLHKTIEERKAKLANFGSVIVPVIIRGAQVPIKVSASPLHPVKSNFKAFVLHNTSEIVKNRIVANEENKDDCGSALDFENMLPEVKISKAVNYFQINAEADISIPILDLTKYKNIMENIERAVNIPIEDYSHVKIPRKKRMRILTKRFRYDDDSYRVFNDLTAKYVTEEKLLELREKDRNDPSYLNAYYKCESCVFGYKDENYYKAHVNKHVMSSYGEEICNVCELRFKDKEALDAHKKSHTVAFFCMKCEYASRFLTSVSSHYKQVHRPAVPPDQYCNKCDAILSSKEDVQIHSRLAHFARPICSYCSKSFKFTSNLRKHIKDVHTERDPLPCQTCGKKFASSMSLKDHIRKYHREKGSEMDGKSGKYYCQLCNKHFRDLHFYKSHLKTTRVHNTSSLRFECDDCGMKYFVKSMLITHIQRVHLKIKRAKCKLCGKLCFNASVLRQHHRHAHLRVKASRNEQCSYCGKTFDKQGLRIHMRVHTGERPFHCPRCEYKATQKASLMTHHKFKHKDAPALKYSDIQHQGKVVDRP